MNSPKRRAYRMTARAEAAAQTQQAIVDAAIRLVGERAWEDVSLADVAEGAGVTVQTVLRKFGSKEGLTEAASAVAGKAVRDARWKPGPGDVAGAMDALGAHYEEWGERSLRFLAQEHRSPAMAAITANGRALHHEWVDHVFGPWLKVKRGDARTRLRAALIAATDVYVWKIMRHDLGLDVKATALAMHELVAKLLT